MFEYVKKKKKKKKEDIGVYWKMTNSIKTLLSTAIVCKSTNS